MFGLALRLRQPLCMIEAMPVNEFRSWLAFLDIIEEERE